MKKVIIIHTSSIVYRGLTDVIKGYFNIDVLIFSSIKESISHPPNAKKLIVFIEPTNQKQINQIRNLDKQSSITLIKLEHESSNDSFSIYDESISIWAEPSYFYNIINPHLSSNDTGEIDKQNSDLTTRETDVLREVSKGFTSKEIADKLHISIHTVISHRKNITSKLGIKSISGLTVYAVINKIVDTNTIDPKSLI